MAGRVTWLMKIWRATSMVATATFPWSQSGQKALLLMWSCVASEPTVGHRGRPRRQCHGAGEDGFASAEAAGLGREVRGWREARAVAA